MVQHQRAFWWGHGVNEKRCHHLNWNTIIKPKALGGLGVRDLEIMNEALVGKLAWRFLNEPNALWVRLLKARYARIDQFWTIQKKRRDSPILKAILAGRSWISKGSIWNIGWLSSVSIWDDPWVPDMPNFMVHGVQGARDKAILVGELINHHDRTWKTTLLEELFTPVECQAIMKISIPCLGDKDSLIWTKTKEGKFSTKSLYHSIVQELPSTPRNTKLNRNWSKLWNYKKISPRVQMFIWRLLHDGLPVGSKLTRFLDDTDAVCHFCKEQVEEIEHVLLRCNFARAVWFLSPLSLRTTELEPGISDLIWSWMASMNEEQLSLALNILWSLWKARCRLVFEKEATSATQVIIAAVKGTEDYFNSTTSGHIWELNTEENNELPSWSLPSDGVVKFNVDGAVREGIISAGVVGRDSSGTVIWCATKVFQVGRFQTGCVDLAEAQAILLCFQVALNLNFDTIVIESDSLNVVNAVNGLPNSCAWRARPIFQEILQLKVTFRSCEVTKVHRHINSWAHELATHAVNHPQERAFSSSIIHPCIAPLVEAQQNV